MRKHIYLHTSNLEYVKSLNKDPNFEGCFQYSKEELEKSSPWEIGRIKAEFCYFHIILGKIPNEKCPWCGTKPELKKLHDYLSGEGMTPERPSSFCMQCMNCGAKGPVTQVNEPIIEDKDFMEVIKMRMIYRYAVRLSWDHELVNPYEKHD